MPFSIEFENDGRGVLVEFTGRVTGDEFIEATKQMYSGDDEGRLRYQIIDLTKAERMQVNDEELRAIALLDKRAAAKNPGQLIALVGPGHIFDGSSRRYAIYAEVWAGFESSEFRSVEQARSWTESRMVNSQSAANANAE